MNGQVHDFRICSLDVDMNNGNEASLYGRRLESITFIPQKMLEMKTMCSSISAGKEQRLTVPRLLLWPTSFYHRGVACSHQKEIDTSCLNNKGAEWYWLSWF
jgi:hypothetical protein